MQMRRIREEEERYRQNGANQSRKYGDFNAMSIPVNFRGIKWATEKNYDDKYCQNDRKLNGENQELYEIDDSPQGLPNANVLGIMSVPEYLLKPAYATLRNLTAASIYTIDISTRKFT